MLRTGVITGLFLFGPAGTYKTSIAAAFLAEQIAGTREATGRYVSSNDLLADVQASYSREGDETRADIVSRYVRTPRLVLDDLGKEKASEHAANVIFQILDGRYRMQKPGRWTIITSNYTLQQLADRFAAAGAAIERRIAELTAAVEMKQIARGVA